MFKVYSTCILLLASSVSQAATVVMDTFDTGLDGWVANTTQTNVTHIPTGGNPDGYIRTDNLGNPTTFGAVGAVNTDADHSGVFADGLWTVSVDINNQRQTIREARLRFRYQSSSFNGWYYVLATDPLASWETYTVSFNTNWSDAVAMANGWVQESTSSSFVDLWNDAYSSEIRLVGSSSTNLIAGIDNYHASYVPIPAAVWLFISGIAGIAGVSRLR